MRNKLAVKSSVLNIVAQVVSLVLSLISTRYFVRQLGVEIRGINGLLMNCLGLLQLSDLGIGNAIVYAMYDPIVKGNKEEVNELMKLYRRVYLWIGSAVFALGVIMSLRLNFFITDTTLKWNYIILLFYVQLITSVSTYFFGAYKRNLLYATQDQYVTVMIDMFVKIPATFIQIIVLLRFKSYLGYLLIALSRTIIANGIISIICDRKHPYLKEKPAKKYEKMPELIDNVKNVFVGRLGGFVYNSTDNFIISHFLGVFTVGYMANYYDIINVIKNLASSISAPIQPMIGNFIREEKDTQKAYDLFLTYTFIRFCIANVVSVSALVMIGPLMELWLGKEFNLGVTIPLLMCMDAFLGMIQGPETEFISVLGLFKNDRNMSIIGMIVNLVVSVILTMKIGVAGTLIGTVIAQLYYWGARSHIVFNKYFKQGLVKYTRHIVEYLIVTSIDIFILFGVKKHVMVTNTWITFIVMCAICIIIELLSIVVSFFRTKEFQRSMKIVLTSLKRRR